MSTRWIYLIYNHLLNTLYILHRSRVSHSFLIILTLLSSFLFILELWNNWSTMSYNPYQNSYAPPPPSLSSNMGYAPPPPPLSSNMGYAPPPPPIPSVGGYAPPPPSFGPNSGFGTAPSYPGSGGAYSTSSYSGSGSAYPSSSGSGFGGMYPPSNMSGGGCPGSVPQVYPPGPVHFQSDPQFPYAGPPHNSSRPPHGHHHQGHHHQGFHWNWSHDPDRSRKIIFCFILPYCTCSLSIR